jgi:tetratricopeptide (TPR) repeat protein
MGDLIPKTRNKQPVLWPVAVLFLATVMVASGRPLHQATAESSTPESEYRDLHLLEPGKPFDSELSSGQTHTFKINLERGQCLHVLVDHWGIDIDATWYGPTGQKITELRCRRSEPTPVTLIAEASGTYRLEVRSLEKDGVPGRYQVKVEEVRPATALDIHRIAAEKAFAKAEELRYEWRVESSRQAIKKYEESLQHWRAVGQVGQEAAALRNTGEIHLLLGAPRTALNFYQQALVLSKNTNDPKSEAEALNGLSDVYLHLGQNQKAMEYSSRALNLSRANDDRQREVQALNSTGKVYYVGFGDLRKSLEYFEQALARSYPISDRRGEAEHCTNRDAYTRTWVKCRRPQTL